MNYLHKLETPLLQLSKKKGDNWTIGDAVKGTFIIGGIGSGKSSGSGRTLAHTYLKSGFGGLVLCAKPDEAETWRQYAKETGRSNSLIVIDGTGNKRFNFIDYELNRIDKGSYTTPLALDAFMKIYEAIKLLDGSGGGGNDRFWSDSVRLLLSHSLDALFFARGEVRFADLMNFIRETPTSSKDLKDPNFINTLHYKIMDLASENVDASHDPDKIATMEAVTDWFYGFYDMDKKTRSNIMATLEAMALDFTKGDLAKIFCTTTNIVPEMSHHGAIIVLDFPLKQWQRGGIIAQQVFKFAWQRAIERRPTDQARPCFLWGDEYQLFISSYDNEFSSTARSAKACTVYLTQSIPALRDATKGTNAKDTVDTLLNNFQTRIIHTCLDDTTRTWASDAIGKCLQWRLSEQSNTSQNEGGGTSAGSNMGTGGGGRDFNFNKGNNNSLSTNKSQGTSEGASKQQVIDYHLQPAFFGSSLRMGGKENKYLVDGVVLVGGKTFDYTKKPFLVVSFPQK